MGKIRLNILGLSSSQSQQGSFALVLGEEDGIRRLPIIIGMFEAQAIAVELEKIVPTRPLTHDLFKSFATTFGFSVEEIFINNLREGVFYAQIVVSDGQNTMSIDARPSDAIAIGLRFDVDIYTTEYIMSEAGIEMHPSENEDRPAAPPKSARKKTFQEQLRDSTAEQLQQMLEQALADEDYEKAAIIRDELNKRN